jgi:hypothetical protein
MTTWLYAFGLQAAAVLALVYLVAIIGARLCGPASRRPPAPSPDAK